MCQHRYEIEIFDPMDHIFCHRAWQELGLTKKDQALTVVFFDFLSKEDNDIAKDIACERAHAFSRQYPQKTLSVRYHDCQGPRERICIYKDGLFIS